MVITLYEKPGCCLCDNARALLEEFAGDIAFELREVDIRDDPAAFTRYRYRIPVITVDGREVLEGRIEAGDLAQALQR
jgi:glutaredoxin